MFNHSPIINKDTTTTATASSGTTAYGSESLEQRFGTARNTILQAQQDIHQLVEAQKESAVTHSDQSHQLRPNNVVIDAQHQQLLTRLTSRTASERRSRSIIPSTTTRALATMGLDPNSLLLPAASMPQQPNVDTYNQILTQIYGFDNPAGLLGLQQIFSGNAPQHQHQQQQQQQAAPARLEGGASSFPQLQESTGLAQEAQSSALKQETHALEQEAVGTAAALDHHQASDDDPSKDPSESLPPDELRTLVSAGVRIKGKIASQRTLSLTLTRIFESITKL